MTRFADLKEGFSKILADPQWLAKILLSGFLLINPFLVALAPFYFQWVGDPNHQTRWINTVFPWILLFNVATFWFPLGFSYEVLRRARNGQAAQLPDWTLSVLPRYAKEGAVKLVITLFTLLLPTGIWTGLCYGIFIVLLGLPGALLPMFLAPALLLTIPLCGVACCRWLDGATLLDSALNYPENSRLVRLNLPDYLLASLVLLGVNAVTTSFFYTIPFATIFGLCLVDTWLGPIYAASAPEPTLRFEVLAPR